MTIYKFSKALLVFVSPSILMSSICITMEGGGVIAERSPTGQHHYLNQKGIDNDEHHEQERNRRLNELVQEEKKRKLEEQEQKKIIILNEVSSLQKELEVINLEIQTLLSFNDDFILPALQYKSERFKKQIEELKGYEESINEETTTKEIQRTIDTIHLRYSSIGADYSIPMVF